MKRKTTTQDEVEREKAQKSDEELRSERKKRAFAAQDRAPKNKPVGRLNWEEIYER